jgi:hypothetical protein
MDNGEIQTSEVLKQPEYKLPTNEQIARDGVEAFGKIYSELPEDLKNYFLDDHWFRTLLIGTTPQKLFEFGKGPAPRRDASEYWCLPKDRVDLLKETIENFAPFIKFYSGNTEEVFTEPGKLWGTIERGSVLNLNAASLVVKNNPDQFPVEARDNPGEWLLNHIDDWDSDTIHNEENEIRYGLLSGFSPDAVELFPRYKKLILDTKTFSYDLGEEQLKFLSDYEKIDDPTPDERLKWSSIVQNLNPQISKEDLAFLASKTRIGGHSSVNHAGFSERDKNFAEQVDKLYQKSGIDDLAQELKKKGLGVAEPLKEDLLAGVCD